MLTATFIFLQNKRIQTLVAQVATMELSDYLGTQVEVGTLEYSFFNKLIVTDVSIHDLHHHPMASIGYAEAHFDFWGFFRRKFTIDELRVDSVYALMETDDTGVSNWDFLVSRFGKSEQPFDALVEVKDVVLSNGRFSVRNLSYDEGEEGLFSVHDIRLDDVAASVALEHFSPDSLNAEIKHLQFRERSGLSLSELQVRLIANRERALIPVLRMEMPHTSLATDTIRIVYDSIDDIGDLYVDVALRSSDIGLQDLRPLHRSLRHLGGTATVEAHIEGAVNRLSAHTIALDYNRVPVLRGRIGTSGLPDMEHALFHAEVSDLSLSGAQVQDFLSDLQGKSVSLPAEAGRLGQVHYKGLFSGRLSHVTAYGVLQTQLGALKANMLVQSDTAFSRIEMSGSVETRRFKLGRLLDHADVGDIGFSIEGTGLKDSLTSLHGEIKAHVRHARLKGYTYRNLTANGHYSARGFDGHLNIDDPNLSTTFDGLIDLTQELPVFQFKLDLRHFKPEELHLSDRYEDADLSGQMAVNMTGNSLDNLNGYVLLDNISFRNGEKRLQVDELVVSSETGAARTRVLVQSDLVQANFSGGYKYSTLPLTIQKAVYRYLPSLFSEADGRRLAGSAPDNEMTFDVYLYDTETLSDVLELPVTLSDISMAKGHISDREGVFSLRAGVPEMLLGGMELSDLTLSCDNHDNRINIAAYLQQGQHGRPFTYMLRLQAQHDTIATYVDWHNQDSIVNRGEIGLLTALHTVAGNPAAALHILPSEIVLTDSTWRLQSGPITLQTDSAITIDNFYFGSHTQSIGLHGRVGATQQDSLQLDLNKIDLGYILDMLPEEMEVSFGGEITGKGYVYSALKQPVFDANVYLRDGEINHSPVGDIQAYAAWNREKQEIGIDGLAFGGGDTLAVVTGRIAPVIDSIDFLFDARGLSLAFLNRYMESFADDLQGRGYGQVRMHGTMKKKDNIHFTGKALVEEGGLSVGILGTGFHFSDSIYLEDTQIRLDSIVVRDAEGHRALLNGRITHDGTFKDLAYRIRIDCANLLAMNTTMADNDFYFGKVYATGNVNISGNEFESNISVNARTEPRTQFNISLGAASVASDNSFITFVQPAEAAASDDSEEFAPKKSQETAHVKLRLTLEATPDASLRLIIDPKTGDVLSARGTGDMVIEYDSNGDVRLLGTYEIESGAYQFTLQNVFRKDFRIEQGSRISWSGDPLNAQVDIRALYGLTASLRDLMDESQIEAVTQRTSVPVNCILNLSGQLTAPAIKFDIELPNSDEALKQQVRNIINTDEMMNRQILYLLIFNKFYTPDYLRNSTTNIGQNEAFSLISSTVTGQINNWISKLTSDFSFGFNMRSYGEGETSSQEYETEILYQPNNRLMVNGNFGYRDDDFATNKFIGDVDVEYLLTQNGRLRMKAYTHTVDKYSLKTAQTMQGVGLVYKEEFNNLTELYHTYREALKKAVAARKEAAAARKEKRKARQEAKKKQKQQKIHEDKETPAD